MELITRADWGAKPWQGTPRSVSLSERTTVMMHYHGDPPPYSTGVRVPREVEAIHLANGWSGVGYHFLVDQDGAVYEGRGWGLVGAHCPGYNRTGFGVYVAIGGSQKPSDAALRAARDVYDEACRRTGRTLAKKGHRDGISTQCPGDPLYDWVRDGMPRPGGGSSPGRPSVSLAKLVAAARNDPPRSGTPVSYSGVKTVEAALVKEGLLASRYADGHFGTATVSAYAAWQRRLGFSGSDADGIPGRTSLTRLGDKYRFDVTG
ncbi:N-acetylmuramoyl-L-alanine amidase [Streptomyces aidingensis]|nr:N-acetylmuramoyl-L-alanine amidase [Streptomyces aidingensis]